MQVRCVKAFGRHAPGNLAEVPDGAAVDPEHWEPVTGPPPPPPGPATAGSAMTPDEIRASEGLPAAPEEGM